MITIEINTTAREELVNITRQVARLVEEQGWQEGALVLFSQHTTCGLTVNEAADPDVARDIVSALARAYPRQGNWRHAEGNSDAHVKTSLTGPSLTLIISQGRVLLGAWQGVYLAEFDGPRTRRVWARFLPA